MAEGPADDSVNGDVVAECDGEVDGGAVRKRVRKDVGDDGAEEAVEVGGLKGGGVADSASEADGFEGGGGIVKVDETMHGGGVLVGEVAMEMVGAAVKAGAGIEKGGEVTGLG